MTDMKTPIQELIYNIELTLDSYKQFDSGSPYYNGKQHAYVNILNSLRSKLDYEKQVIKKAYEEGQIEYMEQHGNLMASNNYYNKMFDNKKSDSHAA